MRGIFDRRRRRGVLLLVVLGLLTMFAMIGLTFVVLTGQERRVAEVGRAMETQYVPPQDDLDRAMAQSGIHPVPTMDLPFDPKTMRAVARGTVPGKDPGIVVEERLTGFARGDEILRTAEVVVND